MGQGGGGQRLWIYPVPPLPFPPPRLRSFTEQPPLAMAAGKTSEQQMSGLIQRMWGHQALQSSQLNLTEVPPIPISLYKKVIPAQGRVLQPLRSGQLLTQEGWIPFGWFLVLMKDHRPLGQTG